VKRNTNIEALRVVAMLMVILLHFLSKGNHLPPLTGSMQGTGYVAWFLESLSIVAVNVYFLISGFFLSTSDFKSKRLLNLVCQVFFYSIVISIIFYALGKMEIAGLYDLLQVVLPIQMKQYWFATAYVGMYLFAPILGIAVRGMRKEQLQITIVGLLLFFSIAKSLLPVHLATDEQGYDLVWFLCVYLVAAYIRLYGIAFYRNAKRAAICYLCFGSGIFLMAMLSRLIFMKTGRMEEYMISLYGYNHIFNLLAAVSLFYVFILSKETSVGRLVSKVAPYTFGVYLLHEQLQLRYLWPSWLPGGESWKVSELSNTLIGTRTAYAQTGASAVWLEGSLILFLLYALGSVLLVFLVGIGIDRLRAGLFLFIAKLLRGTRIDRFLTHIDLCMAKKKNVLSDIVGGEFGESK
jgi:surface polysaccharide O-acyltransferase-like enzyme